MNRSSFLLGLVVWLGSFSQVWADNCQTRLVYQDSSARQVWVTGSFVSWAANPEQGAIPLKQMGSNWSVELTLPAGKNLYKFIVDGDRWLEDPGALSRESDNYGGYNSIYQCGSSQEVARPLPQCGDAEEFDWRDTVMYFALVDRFYNSSGSVSPVAGATGGDARFGPSAQFEGGDFRGVTERMDYLTDLGVTALWISAPEKNRNEAGAAVAPERDPNIYSSYHGYWPSPEFIDFSDMTSPSPRPRVEDRLGSEQDLREMIQAAQNAESANGHGVRVLFDYVMNHVDINSGLYRARPEWFPQFGGSPRLCEPDNLWNDSFWGTRCSFTSYLPSFDFDNADARRWSIDNAIWWAREFGIDGYRLDAIKHVPFEWLTEFRERLSRELPDPKGDRFYLVGETFDYFNRDLLKAYVDSNTMLDGQFDFPFRREACEALFRPSGDMSGFAAWMRDNDGFYDRAYNNPSLMVTWIGNHDIPRTIHYATGQIDNCTIGSNPDLGWNGHRFQQPQNAEPYERLALGFAIMMTSPGIPLIYYGDEIGLAGGGDPDNRRLMPWDDTQINQHQHNLRDQVRSLANLRAEYKVLGRGQRQTDYADRDVWVYTMGGCEDFERVTVVINKADAWRSAPLPGNRFQDLISGDELNADQLNIGPRSYRIFKAL